MANSLFTWKIAGPSGFGVNITGQIFTKCALRHGLYVFGYREYPSLIKGGHAFFQIEASNKKLRSSSKLTTLLVALDKESINLHLNEIKKGGGVIYDQKIEKNFSKEEVNFYPLPLVELAIKNGGKEIMQNSVALGASVALLNLDLKILNQVLKDTFKKREKDIRMNLKAAEAGFNYIKKNFKTGFTFKFRDIQKVRDKILLSGNEAIALGAIKAGLKFLAAYPMTPATSILHLLAQKQRDFNIIVSQTEDEISAIHMALGASYAGVRAMTCTSGGGFALMNEALSLSGMTETPLVIIEAQRPGPATGLPTWTSQEDLNYVLVAGHGEFPRIIIAPGDTKEAFYETVRAFYLAEKYQLPVIILSDKFLSESSATSEKEDFLNYEAKEIKNTREGIISPKELKNLKLEVNPTREKFSNGANKWYKRYQFTENGISPRSLPGQMRGVHLTNSDEHDEYGFSSEESQNRIKMMDKRMKKLELAAKELPGPKVYGPESSDLTLISWGSTKGVILDALESVESNKKINFLHLTYIWPFPSDKVVKILKRASRVLILENNKTGQLAGLIRKETGILIKDKFLKYDGRPFFKEEIIERIKSKF